MNGERAVAGRDAINLEVAWRIDGRHKRARFLLVDEYKRSAEINNLENFGCLPST
jgi:hypothetical protein